MCALPNVLYQAKRNLAIALFDSEAVLTAESDSPLVIKRNGPNGVERGFKLKLHEKNPEAPLSPFFLNLSQSPINGQACRTFLFQVGGKFFVASQSPTYGQACRTQSPGAW